MKARRFWCWLLGHAEPKVWYEPWTRDPMTGQWKDRRQVYTVCMRCNATLDEFTETAS